MNNFPISLREINSDAKVATEHLNRKEGRTIAQETNRETTAVFIPAYCLRADQKELTLMSKGAVAVACNLINHGVANHVLCSTAYRTWEREAEFKRKHMVKFGITDNIHVLPDVEDSFDEAEKTMEIVTKLGIRKIFVVADKFHAPRVELIFRALFPSLQIEVVQFMTCKLERTHEPHPIWLFGWVKGVRAENKLLWIIWNLLLYIMTPRMLRKRFRKK